MRNRPLSPEETALWARVIATVEPLEGRATAAPFVSSEVEKREPAPQPTQRVSTPLERSGVKRPKPPANTLDGSWDRRLSRGLVQPDLSIDLHGHTLDSAYRTLDAGIGQAVARGARLLLLVTGKPRDPSSGRGAIRAAVGDWLAASRHADRIAAVRGAHPRHGGTGALYIVLRRPRTS